MKDVKRFLDKIPSVYKFYSRDLVDAKMEAIADTAKFVGATVPANVEDIALQFSVTTATHHLHNMATSADYVAKLEEKREQARQSSKKI